MISDIEQEKKLVCILNELKQRLDGQFNSIDTIDNKTGILIGFVVIVIITLMNSSWFYSLDLCLITPILFGFLLSVYFCMRELLVATFQRGLEPKELIGKFLEDEKNKDRMYADLLSTSIETYKKAYYTNLNNKNFTSKKGFYNHAIISIFCTLSLLCVYFVFFR